jgi:hypothetical protein
MSTSPCFIVVENRQNNTLDACVEAATLAGEKLVVLSGTDAGVEYDEFSARYVHLSSNSAAFEIICFRRYFLLEKYLAATPSCKRFVLIDSDVLIFRGIGEHFRKIGAKGAGFAGSAIARLGWDPHQVSPHVSYWTRDALRRFINYILNIYKHPAGIQNLRQISMQFRQHGSRGGVSDMTLLYLWANAEGHMLHSNQRGPLGVVDHNINLPHNRFEHEFRMRWGAKRLTYRHGKPFLTLPDGRDIPALALHFQGASKAAMRNALLGQEWRFMFKAMGLYLARNIKERLFRLQARMESKKNTDSLSSIVAAGQNGGNSS